MGYAALWLAVCSSSARDFFGRHAVRCASDGSVWLVCIAPFAGVTKVADGVRIAGEAQVVLA